MKFEKKLEPESLRLVSVSSFGSWDPEVLNKSQELTSMHILPLEMKGLVSIMPRLLFTWGKNRKIPLCLNSKFYQQRIPLQQKSHK